MTEINQLRVQLEAAQEAARTERAAYDDLLARVKVQESRLDDLRELGIAIQRNYSAHLGAEVLRRVDGPR